MAAEVVLQWSKQVIIRWRKIRTVHRMEHDGPAQSLNFLAGGVSGMRAGVALVELDVARVQPGSLVPILLS